MQYATWLYKLLGLNPSFRLLDISYIFIYKYIDIFNVRISTTVGMWSSPKIPF